MSNEEVVIIGGTSGIGRGIAQAYADRGASVAITGRSAAAAEKVASEIGATTRGLAVDLSDPATLADQLNSIEAVSRLVVTAAAPNQNAIETFDVRAATELAVMKLVAYPAVVSVLRPRLTAQASILLFGGNSKDRPFPGSTGLTSANGGVAHLVLTLAQELAPARINAVHPGIVIDTPAWADAARDFVDTVRGGTPTGELVRVANVVDASVFLLENPAVTGQNLNVDGGSGL